MAARRRLDAELVRRQLAVSRAHAHELIAESRVLVNGAVAGKPAHLVASSDNVTVTGPAPRFVGRGGEKLDAALDHFAVDVTGRRVLDCGASTGGFTDCLLQRGAAEVVALDVGHGQLHPRIRGDGRVTVLERTNIRTAGTETIGGRGRRRCCRRLVHLADGRDPRPGGVVQAWGADGPVGQAAVRGRAGGGQSGPRGRQRSGRPRRGPCSASRRPFERRVVRCSAGPTRRCSVARATASSSSMPRLRRHDERRLRRPPRAGRCRRPHRGDDGLARRPRSPRVAAAGRRCRARPRAPRRRAPVGRRRRGGVPRRRRHDAARRRRPGRSAGAAARRQPRPARLPHRDRAGRTDRLARSRARRRRARRIRRLAPRRAA